MRLLTTVLLTLSGLFGTAFLLADQSMMNECKDFKVTLNKTQYELSPLGGDQDDAEAIMCALNSANKQAPGNAKVKLLKAGLENPFNLKSVIDVTGFNGTLEGAGMDKTLVQLADYAFDCSSEKVRPIMFRGGSVTLQYMTIAANKICESDAQEGAGQRNDTSLARPSVMPAGPAKEPTQYRTEGGDEGDGTEGENARRYTLVSFAQESCAKRAHFAVIDRVRLIGLSDDDGPYTNTGLSYFGTVDGSCEEEGKGPTGTLKINRSEVTGFDTGIYSSVVGQGQVDINFNTIRSKAWGIYVQDANQAMTVVGNKIYVGDQAYGKSGYPWCYLVGVEVAASSDWAPDQNRSWFANNQISIGAYSPGGCDNIQALGIIVGAWNEARPKRHSVAILNNTINMPQELQAPVSYGTGISVQDTDDAIIQNNRFTGAGDTGIYFGDWAFFEDITGGQISGNSFKNYQTDREYYLGLNTKNSIIYRFSKDDRVEGPSPENNFILDPDN